MTEKSMNPEFNSEKQLLRAIGIILVVLGHAIDPFIWNSSFKVVKDIIYSFHMPLFFFISGFFGTKFFLPADRPINPIVVRQFQRFMVVYFFCSMLVIPLKFLLNHYADRPLVAGDILADIFFCPGHHPMIILWFLYVLFLMQMFFLAGNHIFTINYRRPFQAGMLFIVFLGLHLISGKCPELFALNRLAYFAIYFYLGFLASFYYEKLKSFFIRYRYFAMIMSIIFYLFYFQARSFFMFSFLYAMTGILFFWLVSIHLAKRRTFFKSSLSRIGNYSYEIYLYHYFFMAGLCVLLVKIPKTQSLLPFAPIFIFSLVCPMILSKYCLRKNHLLRRFALGDWSKPGIAG